MTQLPCLSIYVMSLRGSYYSTIFLFVVIKIGQVLLKFSETTPQKIYRLKKDLVNFSCVTLG